MRPVWVLLVTAVALLGLSLAPVASALAAPAGHPGAAPAAARASTAVSAPSSPASTAAAPHAGPVCPTPQNLPDWTSSEFFNDVLVTFTVPGHQNLSGADFQTVPCLNALPTYLPGFWMNISTDVAISQAFVNIWGTLYPTPFQPLADLPGFPYDTNVITQLPMYTAPGALDQASFWFDTHRYFYPGSTVYFNVTVKTTAATPGSVNSGGELGSPYPKGSNLNATWQFSLDSPWWSPNFASDIAVSTTPSVLGGGTVYEPNENQSLLVTLQSLGPDGGTGGPIPYAELALTISNDPGFNGTFGIPFGAANHTWQNLTSEIGPYPGASVSISVSAYLPWEGGHIDTIQGPDHNFTWSKGGGWPTPSLGLAANALLSSTPSVLGTGTATTLSSGTPVNVSLVEPIENVTISTAIVRFHFSDADGSVAGIVPMHLVRQNATYAVLPGFPSGGRLTFSVLAKDVFGVPLASGNYTYLETGTPVANLTPSFSYFYVEGINVSTGTLLTGASYTVSNASWSQTAVTTPFGFGLLLIPNGAGTLDLPYGTYTVSMTAVGHTQTTSVTLGSPNPPTVRFYFANGPVAADSVLPLSPITIGLVAGIVVLTLALYPLLRWFQERLRRAEKERTRVTL
jgi:hypothetical protein